VSATGNPLFSPLKSILLTVQRFVKYFAGDRQFSPRPGNGQLQFNENFPCLSELRHEDVFSFGRKRLTVGSAPHSVVASSK
jgi:hypothetical protein